MWHPRNRLATAKIEGRSQMTETVVAAGSMNSELVDADSQIVVSIASDASTGLAS